MHPDCCRRAPPSVATAASPLASPEPGSALEHQQAEAEIAQLPAGGRLRANDSYACMQHVPAAPMRGCSSLLLPRLRPCAAVQSLLRCPPITSHAISRTTCAGQPAAAAAAPAPLLLPSPCALSSADTAMAAPALLPDPAAAAVVHIHDLQEKCRRQPRARVMRTCAHQQHVALAQAAV